MIWGANDRVISDVAGSIRAADQILKVRQVVIPKCGHAPQIEKARLVNQLVVRFLRDKLKTDPPDARPRPVPGQARKRRTEAGSSRADAANDSHLPARPAWPIRP